MACDATSIIGRPRQTSTRPSTRRTRRRLHPHLGRACYRECDRGLGKFALEWVIDSVAGGVPAALVEVRQLGRTLKRRAADIVAYFDHPGTSNGPTEATGGRLEHLRGSALGFRNLAHYIARFLLEAGGFKRYLHP